MELLDRYLQAVKKHLPWQRQDDIIAELRANLESQLDEKQAELGRTLTPGEAEAWLRQLGSPVEMASHYQPQQYLIGPAVYPVYMYVLRLASMWAIVIYAIVSAVTLVFGTMSADAVAEAALRLPFILIQVAAWVTLVFAALEFVAVRFPDKCPPIAGLYVKWTPSDLPPLEQAPPPGQKRRSYAHAVTEVIFGFIFLIWLLLLPRFPFLMFGPGAALLHASAFRLAPIWLTFYWWVVGINVMQLAWNCFNLVRGGWQQPDRVKNMAIKAFNLIPFVWLASIPGHVYVLLRHPAIDELRYGQTLDGVNRGIHLALLVLCAIIAIQLAWDIAQAIFDWWRGRTLPDSIG